MLSWRKSTSRCDLKARSQRLWMKSRPPRICIEEAVWFVYPSYDVDPCSEQQRPRRPVPPPCFQTLMGLIMSHMPLLFRALSMLLSALVRPPCPSPGPSISLTLSPALDPFPLPPPSRVCAGGGVRPLSRAGGSTCGGCSPPAYA